MRTKKQYSTVVNRRRFLKNFGAGTVGIMGLSHGCFGDIKDAKVALLAENTSGSKKWELPEYYNLPWLSDIYSPDLQDIGVGLGCLKIIGNTANSFPLCPGVQLLPTTKDPIRKSWVPHGYSPVEPNVEASDVLELVSRKWTPWQLESEYKLQGVAISQIAMVFDYGASVQIRSSQLTNLTLTGHSYGPSKVWADKQGLHIVETSPQLRPMAYTIRLNPMPQIILIEDSKERPIQSLPEAFNASVHWRFQWKTFPGIVNMEANIQRDGSFRKLEKLDFDARLKTTQQQWETYYETDIPRFDTPDERINRFCDYMAYVFRSNGLRQGGLLSHPYSMPKQTFCGWWMWDLCFHAIGARWYAERELAWGGLLNIENVQYPPGILSAGTVTNSARPYGVDVFITDDALSPRLTAMPLMIPKVHGDGSHPPIFAQALKSLWLTEGNDLNMRRLLPNALAYHDWFERRRRSETLPGLLLVRRWSDTGMDNSPRWGTKGSGIYDTGLRKAHWGIPMVTVDLNVYSVLEKQCLAEMLLVAGNPEKAAAMKSEAEQRTALIHQFLWDESRGFYMDRNESGGAFIPVMSPAGFYPLLLDELEESRCDQILKNLFDEKKFWAEMPIPSVAMDDPHFKAEHSYGAGGTWMNYVAYTLRGLFRYRPDAAWKLLDRVLEGLMPQKGPNIFENYNPLTRQGYDSANFYWHGLLVDVIIHDMLAIEPTREGLRMGEPRCPETWQKFEIGNLFCGGRAHHIVSVKKEEKWMLPHPAHL